MSGWLLLFGVGVTFAWMIAYLALFMTVFTGSWVWNHPRRD
jgi:uncharacterized iron-regulated membrane protein